MRNLPPVDNQKPVVVPGDFEREHMTECDELGGIPYPPVLIESLNRLADQLKVDKMKIIKIL
ncbi:unnamed protein product [Schistosoma mattheei]|nr:unnamed protein product [Schistosoma mattheei]